MTTRSRSVLERLKEQGEEVLNRISDEVMSSEYFAKAMQGAMKGKEMIDQAVGKALKQMNIPTRSEFRRAVQRIDALERELAEVKAAAAAKKTRPRKSLKPGSRSE
jgi:polyhydroxyalkanoate synthesis regulator phasin